MAGGDTETIVEVDPEARAAEARSNGNSNCFVCRRMHSLPFIRCRYCDLPGANHCSTLQVGLLLMLLTFGAGVLANLIGGQTGETLFVLTGLCALLVLFLTNAYYNEKARTQLRLIHLQQELTEQHEFLKELSPQSTMDGCLEQIIASTVARLNCRRISIMLVDEAQETLHIAASRGLPPETVARTRVPIGQRTAGRVFQSDKPIHLRYADMTDRDDDVLPTASDAALSGPLMLSGMHWGNIRLGVLSVTEPIGREDFSVDDEFVFCNICQAAAVAIHSLKAVEKVKQGHAELLETLVNALEVRDPYTRGHSERVSRYAVVIGRRLMMSPESLTQLKIAGWLHDIGKIGIPDAILHKPGALTDQEHQIIRSHIEGAAEMLSRASLVANAMDVIVSHHERLDGSGYPQGLTGSEIPLPARIVGLADTLDAMTTARPYNQPVSIADAVERLTALRGTKFDPACVDALTAAVADGDLADLPPEGPCPTQLAEAAPVAARAQPSDRPRATWRN